MIGFYSIAKPFYIDRLLTEDEIQRYAHLLDGNAGFALTYHFHNPTADFGPVGDTSLLHLPADCGPGYRTGSQNANYTEQASGAFKASSENKNLLKKKPITDGEAVVLSSADSYILYNINISAHGDVGRRSFVLEPNGANARYYFGDRNGNYGLKANPYYSISGYVTSLESGTQARLVLRINGIAQSYDLKQGDFHFVYDNSRQKGAGK